MIDYLKNYDNLSPEDRFTIDVLKQKAGAFLLEDTAWYWENQKQVTLYESDVLSLEPIKSLRPEYLVLFGNRVSDITPICNMESLIHLNLAKNNIRFLDGIEKLVGLRELFLGFNQIKDISPLTNMRNLKLLVIRSNQIKDINSLKSLTGLVKLNLSDNPLNLAQIDSLRGSLPGCNIIYD